MNLKKLNIHGGPRNLQHEANSLQSRLTRFYDSFRKSFALTMRLPYFSQYRLRMDDFPSDNFHRNLGYLRFY